MAVAITNYKPFHNSDKVMNHNFEAQVSPNIVHLIIHHPLQLFQVFFLDIERKSSFKLFGSLSECVHCACAGTEGRLLSFVDGEWQGNHTDAILESFTHHDSITETTIFCAFIASFKPLLCFLSHQFINKATNK